MTFEKFARQRGFEPQELEKYGWRYEDGHIRFPTLGRRGAWYDERLRCDRGCHPKYWQPAGSASHLYNPLGLGPHSAEVWFAEGELDTLSLVVAGVPALGVPGAGTFNGRTLQLLFSKAEIVLALDPDEAGRTYTDKITQLFEPDQVSVFDPSPFEDLNDWFQADREGFTKTVTTW